MFTEEETGIRSVLLRAVVKFVIRAQTFPGISRIALVGSLTTPKLNPKDADLLVTVSDDADLKPLATAGRQLKGALQSHSHGADIFLANSSGDYIGRTCSWKDCRPGIRIRCKALNSGLRPYLYDDLEVIRSVPLRFPVGR